jgi:hypothetical protein
MRESVTLHMQMLLQLTGNDEFSVLMSCARSFRALGNFIDPSGDVCTSTACSYCLDNSLIRRLSSLYGRHV